MGGPGEGKGRVTALLGPCSQRWGLGLGCLLYLLWACHILTLPEGPGVSRALSLSRAAGQISTNIH